MKTAIVNILEPRSYHCQVASCKPRGGVGSVSGHQIGRHQKQLPEQTGVSEISSSWIQKAGADTLSQVSVPQLTQSTGGGLRIGSWSHLGFSVLLGIFPPQTKSRIWDETPFTLIFGSISGHPPLPLWLCPVFLLDL